MSDFTPKRRWLRFSLRTLFVVMTVFACWLAYELNWIRQRRALGAEGEVILGIVGNYASPQTSEDIPPTGSTVAQRMLLLLGEPAVTHVDVFYIIDDDGTKRDRLKDGMEYEVPKEATDYPKVRRAQALFPEAEIRAIDIQQSFIQGPDAFLTDVKGLVSE